MATIYAIRNDKEKAYTWLRMAIDIGWRDFRLALLDPRLDNLHGDEQFKSMMDEVKAMVHEMRERVKKMDANGE